MADFSHNLALQRTAFAPSVRASREVVSARCAPPAPPRPSLSLGRWTKPLRGEQIERPLRQHARRIWHEGIHPTTWSLWDLATGV